MSSANFTVLLTRQFEKDLKKLPANIKNQLLTALQQLAIDPYYGDQLKGLKIGQRKWRIGNYRIRYDIEGKKVILHAVKHRKDVYKTR